MRIHHFYITKTELLDGPSHFLKFEIIRELQLNTYLKGIQKKY